MAAQGPQRRARPPVAPIDINVPILPTPLRIRAPGAPKKRHPIATRLTVEEYNAMNKHDRQMALQKAYDDDYGSALPVDLDALPPIPVGDKNDPEYSKLHVGVAGILGGRRRRKSKSKSRRTNKRKSRKSKSKSRKSRRTNKRKSRKSRK